jgi:hypothetical protein
MSVDLSHRLAKVALHSPIVDLSLAERRRLWLACERADDFTSLTADHQHLIIAAEASRAAAIEEMRRRATA